jgi:translation elongation factor EF-4
MEQSDRSRCPPCRSGWAKLKDGTTHLAYKAEHVLDLETQAILAAEVYHADYADTQTLEDSLHQAQLNQEAAGSEAERQEALGEPG